MGQDPTTFEAWSVDPTKFWQGE